MERFDAINPMDYRYVPRDEELSSKLISYNNLDVITKIKRVIPEILVPRLNSLESKLREIAIENKYKEIPRRIDGRHSSKLNPSLITIEEVFNRYATRLAARINKLDRLGFNFHNVSGHEINDYISDIVYYAVSALSIEANIADDIRQQFRSEIEEYGFKEFEQTRVGSSTMPHKMNPAEFENIKSSWKHYMTFVSLAIASQIIEHQGDSTHEDFPYFTFELLGAVSYATKSLKDSLKNLEIKV